MSSELDEVTLRKRAAAEYAVDWVQTGMVVGLGAGSTARFAVERLGAKLARGELVDVRCVPCSIGVGAVATRLGIAVTTLETSPVLDLAIDGADEVDPQLRLIKGAGGALLREKIVAAASARMIVIADQSKVVETLGAFPLPIEINPFGQVATRIAIEKLASRSGLSGALTMRSSGDGAFMTDGGHLILDASFSRIPDAEALARELNTIPGVVEHGLFINLASLAIIAGPEGARVMQAV